MGGMGEAMLSAPVPQDGNSICFWRLSAPKLSPSHSHGTKTPLYRSGRRKTLDHQRPEKMGPGWHLWPRAFALQASVMTAGVRDDVSHEYELVASFA